jgi:hypothetical protein
MFRRKILLVSSTRTEALGYIRMIGGLHEDYICLVENDSDNLHKLKGYTFRPEDIKILGNPMLPFSVWEAIQKI